MKYLLNLTFKQLPKTGCKILILFALTLSCTSNDESSTKGSLDNKTQSEEKSVLDETTPDSNELEEVSLPLPETLELDIDGVTSYRENPYEEFSIYEYNGLSAIGLVYPNGEGVSLFIIKENGFQRMMNSNGFPVSVITTYEAVDQNNECFFTLADKSAQPRHLSYTCQNAPNTLARWEL